MCATKLYTTQHLSFTGHRPIFVNLAKFCPKSPLFWGFFQAGCTFQARIAQRDFIVWRSYMAQKMRLGLSYTAHINIIVEPNQPGLTPNFKKKSRKMAIWVWLRAPPFTWKCTFSGTFTFQARVAQREFIVWRSYIAQKMRLGFTYTAHIDIRCGVSW